MQYEILNSVEVARLDDDQLARQIEILDDILRGYDAETYDNLCKAFKVMKDAQKRRRDMAQQEKTQQRLRRHQIEHEVILQLQEAEEIGGLEDGEEYAGLMLDLIGTAALRIQQALMADNVSDKELSDAMMRSSCPPPIAETFRKRFLAAGKEEFYLIAANRFETNDVSLYGPASLEECQKLTVKFAESEGYESGQEGLEDNYALDTKHTCFNITTSREVS